MRPAPVSASSLAGRAARPARWLPLLGAAALAACGGPPEGHALAPAPSADAGPSATLQLGLGELDFEPLAADEAVVLVEAAQGGGGAGAHVWVALLAHGLDPRGVEVKVEARRVSDGALVAEVARREDLVARGADQVLVGLRAVVTACADLAGQELSFTATVTDARAVQVTDRRRGRGPDACPRPCLECDGLGG